MPNFTTPKPTPIPSPTLETTPALPSEPKVPALPSPPVPKKKRGRFGVDPDFDPVEEGGRKRFKQPSSFPDSNKYPHPSTPEIGSRMPPRFPYYGKLPAPVISDRRPAYRRSQGQQAIKVPNANYPAWWAENRGQSAGGDTGGANAFYYPTGGPSLQLIRSQANVSNPDPITPGPTPGADSAEGAPVLSTTTKAALGIGAVAVLLIVFFLRR